MVAAKIKQAAVVCFIPGAEVPPVFENEGKLVLQLSPVQHSILHSVRAIPRLLRKPLTAAQAAFLSAQLMQPRR